MKLELLSAAVVAPLAMFMLLDTGPVQAADGSCSFSERTSVFGSDCRAPQNVRGDDRTFKNFRFKGPSKKVVEVEEEERNWDRDRKRGKKGPKDWGRKGHKDFGKDRGKDKGKDRGGKGGNTPV